MFKNLTTSREASPGLGKDSSRRLLQSLGKSVWSPRNSWPAAGELLTCPDRRRPVPDAMADEFYDPGAQRAAKVKALFTRIAPRYDLINDLQSFGLHRRWKRAVIMLARPETGVKALDVCCGTGDLALALAERGAEVIGLDFSERMLEIARARAARSAVARPPMFVVGDAQELPFPENTFDIVTVGYGLRNLQHWQKGLAEMHRVAKPGGRVLVLDFGKPENQLWRSLYFGYLQLFVPILGLVFCGSADAYAYILESLKHYPAQTGVRAEMAELKMRNVRLHEFLRGIMSINCGDKWAGPNASQ